MIFCIIFRTGEILEKEKLKTFVIQYCEHYLIEAGKTNIQKCLTCNTLNGFTIRQILYSVHHCKLIENLASMLEGEASFIATFWAFIGHLSQLMKMIMGAYLQEIS